MLTVYGDRPHFYQWDLNQRLIVDNPDVIEVHFSNTRVKPAPICEVYEEAGVRYANVPNILLQQPLAIMAHGCCAECVRDELIIRVVGRTKPADYIYTETEIRSFESLQKRVEDVADRAEAATEEAEASAQKALDAERGAASSAENAAESEAASEQSAESAAADAASASASAEASARDAATASDSADLSVRSAERAEQAAATHGYVFFEVDDRGHLIMTKTENVETLDFRLNAGRLEAIYG